MNTGVNTTMILSLVVQNLNVVAFENMTALERLTLVKLPTAHLRELCNMLAVIDVIATDDIEVSCFELMAGESLPDSMHKPASKIPAAGMILGWKLLIQCTNVFSPLETEPKQPPPDRRRIAPMPRPAATSTSTETSPTIATTTSTLRPDVDTGSGHNATIDDHRSEPTSNGTSSAETGQPAVNIETYKLRKILIISMVVAVVGLLIGIVCRVDLCGVKTKLCRTRTRGPAATDQVQPAEQVPLKDIELGPIKAAA